jgi:hypothetical protein
MTTTLIQRQIAGLSMTIEGDPSHFMSQLEKELAIYPLAQSETDIHFRFGRISEELTLTQNPGIHHEYADGFAANFGQAVVRWHWGKRPLTVDWHINAPPRHWRRKLRSVQYAHPSEQTGQVFFELVLIPTLQLFYHDRLLLLHGSALLDRKDHRAIVFGGTGGIGKTSLELALVNDGYDFMADDISILDASGLLHANFAWPKIYGYNTQDDGKIKKRIFRSRGPLDRLLWETRMRRYGGSLVRRRVNPQSFFDGAICQQAKLKAYYLLFRDNVDAVRITSIDAATTISMSLDVMKAEYTVLYRHLHWHDFNRVGMGLSPLVTAQIIFDGWQKAGESVFSDIDCYLVHVPFGVSAVDLRTSLPDLLRQL